MTETAFPTLSSYREADADQLRALYEAIFDRIEKHNGLLRIFEDLLPDKENVLRQIEELFVHFPDKNSRPPLFGVPFGIKGIFRAQGFCIRGGSLLPSDIFDGQEAIVVSRLREAGAIALGITATTEFAYAAPAATCNPRNPAHTPGGSSSGSAAGVAAGFFPLALGTQTIGSVMRPASYCGITGFKPSHDLVSTEGLLYFSRSVDQVGFFCASPQEIEQCLAALAPMWAPQQSPAALRMGVPRGPYLEQAKSATLDWLEARLDELRNAGFEIIDAPCLENITVINELHRGLIEAEFAAEHKDLFARYQPLYRPQTAECILRGRQLGQKAILDGKKSQISLRLALSETMRAGGLDAFICPSTTAEADKGLLSTGDPVMNLPWTHSGLPAVSLPAGNGAGGLPLGLQLVGAFGKDAELLAVARRVHECFC